MKKPSLFKTNIFLFVLCKQET